MPTDVLAVIVLLLVGSASFGLGMLVGKDEGSKGSLFYKADTLSPIAPEQGNAVPITTSAPEGAMYVASKNGTKYFLPWCGSAKLIKEENKVWFTSKEEAESRGYSPAGNCKGI